MLCVAAGSLRTAFSPDDTVTRAELAALVWRLDGRPRADWGQTDAPTGKFSAVSAGSVHSCALRTTGEIACWGNTETRHIDPDGRLPPIGDPQQLRSGST